MLHKLLIAMSFVGLAACGSGQAPEPEPEPERRGSGLPAGYEQALERAHGVEDEVQRAFERQRERIDEP